MVKDIVCIEDIKEVLYKDYKIVFMDNTIFNKSKGLEGLNEFQSLDFWDKHLYTKQITLVNGIIEESKKITDLTNVFHRKFNVLYLLVNCVLKEEPLAKNDYKFKEYMQYLKNLLNREKYSIALLTSDDNVVGYHTIKKMALEITDSRVNVDENILKEDYYYAYMHFRVLFYNDHTPYDGHHKSIYMKGINDLFRNHFPDSYSNIINKEPLEDSIISLKENNIVSYRKRRILR